MIRRQKGMRKILGVLMLISTVLFSAAVAWALDLESAKAQGLVGETAGGYLAAVKPSPEVDQLVRRINGERKARYQQIAKKNGTPITAVETIAGKKAIEMTPPGQFVQSGGGWKKK